MSQTRVEEASLPEERARKSTFPRIAVIGNAVVDVYLLGVPDWPRKNGERVYATGVEHHPGGTGLNVAVALAKLGGMEVDLFTAMGTSSQSELLKRAARLHNPRSSSEERELASPVTIFDAAEGEVDTSIGVVRIDSNAFPYFVHYHGISHLLDLPFLLRHIDRIASADFLYIGAQSTIESFGYSEIVDLLVRVREKNRETKVVLDVSLLSKEDAERLDVAPTLAGLLPKVDFFIPNDAECLQYSGKDDIESAGQRLSQHIRAGGAVIVKNGEHGVHCYMKGKKNFSVPALRAEDFDYKVVDTLGAGDTWGAGFVSALARGRSLEHACRMGNAVAAHSIQRHGATTAIRGYEPIEDWAAEGLPEL
jgi:sugar/nucleoside kinase (ribokinase family)